MKNNDLSEKQARILNLLKKEIKEKGYQPAIRDICAELGLSSTATVHTHLINLEKKGYIRRNPTKNRCIEIIEQEGEQSDTFYKDGVEYVSVPIVGKVTAGAPILAAEDLEGYFPVPAHMLKNCDAFMLRVKGDSMKDAGILNGDLIIVKQQNSADNGDIIVALIDDSATVKRYFKEKHTVRLCAENPAFEDILTKEAEVLGKVIGLFRSF